MEKLKVFFLLKREDKQIDFFSFVVDNKIELRRRQKRRRRRIVASFISSGSKHQQTTKTIYDKYEFNSN